MAKFSKTVNPLHFEDLEPHRFEDLVRQLAYDFRIWHSIETTGRLGSDEGIDIRAIERLPALADGDEENEGGSSSHDEHVWIIQCKREKRIGPTKIKEIFAAAVNEETTIPYGFILAAACDFSYRSREVFRLEANRLGIDEFFLWGKAELEDMLFLPKNDHLLFAYFGLSLQVRRRSERTALNNRLVIKRKLVNSFKSLTGPFHQTVLLRDAAAAEYPHHGPSVVFGKNDRWRYYRFAGHIRPDHIALIAHEYWAWAKFDENEWDFISDFDQSYVRHPRVVGVPREFPKVSDDEETARRYWLTRVPKDEQAHYRVYGFIHYDRILAIDDIGDYYHEAPHIIVDCSGVRNFFKEARDVVENNDGWSARHLFVERSKRASLFPKIIPKVSDEEFNAALGIKP